MALQCPQLARAEGRVAAGGQAEIPQGLQERQWGRPVTRSSRRSSSTCPAVFTSRSAAGTAMAVQGTPAAAAAWCQWGKLPATGRASSSEPPGARASHLWRRWCSGRGSHCRAKLLATRAGARPRRRSHRRVGRGAARSSSSST
ncbi:MAG: hypothetical protein ERJ68_06260 [Aphanocapsa feldmannii 277cI]|uniref:Uncharacterized protein n=1 Tax=Aphanocapsa feldmannii 277cI TaxID=2507554 RepID=A0A524RSV9_9CHRO|nr:MAG: hypothetical protein ERJ68_06260 [Aphanocapsa feldmannii 277cI]